MNNLDPLGLCPPEDLLHNFSNACAGFGDAATLGLTGKIRESMGCKAVVNHSSGWYSGGQVAGTVVGTIALEGAGGALSATKGADIIAEGTSAASRLAANRAAGKAA